MKWPDHQHPEAMEEPANDAPLPTAPPEKHDHPDGGDDEESPNVHDDAREPAEDGEKREYLSGVRLWLLLASITLVAFVMLLDMSIIVTASFSAPALSSGC